MAKDEVLLLPCLEVQTDWRDCLPELVPLLVGDLSRGHIGSAVGGLVAHLHVPLHDVQLASLDLVEYLLVPSQDSNHHLDGTLCDVELLRCFRDLCRAEVSHAVLCEEALRSEARSTCRRVGTSMSHSTPF